MEMDMTEHLRKWQANIQFPASYDSCLSAILRMFWFLSLRKLFRHDIVYPKTFLLYFVCFFLHF